LEGCIKEKVGWLSQPTFFVLSVMMEWSDVE